MVPDKIYINGFSAFATEPIKDGTEYIRKEALLEWLIEKYNGYTEKMFEKNMDETHWGQRNAFQQVIDKLNSL